MTTFTKEKTTYSQNQQQNRKKLKLVYTYNFGLHVIQVCITAQQDAAMYDNTQNLSVDYVNLDLAND